MGVARFIVDKDAALRFDFDDPRESFNIKGKFVRSEDVEGKKEMVALALKFEESQVPTGYKVRINDYFNTVTAVGRTGNESES